MERLSSGKDKKMILADKIINERKKNGWSQEELAEMLEVSRQSVSKWEGAQSVPDLARIIKMAEIFNVSTDYLLKDEIEPENTPMSYPAVSEEPSIDIKERRRVTLEEASEYLSIRADVMPKVGLGVFLCITCPVMLIFLEGASSFSSLGLTSEIAAGVGLFFLFAQIGIAVALFIRSGLKQEKYEFLEKETFETAYGVDGMVKEKMVAYEHKNTMALVIGVLLCIFCPVPLVVCSALGANGFPIICLVCLLLIMVATGVYSFIAICGMFSSYKILLQDGDYTPEKKAISNKIGPIAGVYWMVIVAAYLAISFITGSWKMTWIIWPVAGVLYAALHTILSLRAR